MNKVFTVFLGIVIGSAITFFVLTEHKKQQQEFEPEQRKPLYWVAPMDPNFRRNEPGMSPMGMELVPVFAENNQQPGVINITPTVVQNLGVKTVEVKRQPLIKTINAMGKVKYNQNLMSHVHPRVTGWINKLFHKSIGLHVKKGDPLFTLYSLELINAQEELILAINSKRNNLIESAKNKLHSLNISNKTIERITKQKKSEQYITFYAPQDGIISHLNVSEGYYVEPKDEIMALADLSEVWIESELTEQQLAWVKLKDDVIITTRTLPHLKLVEEIDFIYPFIDNNTHSAIIRATIDNKDQKLKPNMIAEIKIIPTQLDQVLVVPNQSVIRLGNQNRVVWAISPGQYKSIAITTGQSNHDFTEVISGLEPGDFVVSSAQFLLDSESSRSSDLNRYEYQEPAKSSARTFGIVQSIDQEKIIIYRDAIEQWNRPAAEVEFETTIDSGQLKKGQKLDFTFEVNNNQFVITEIHQVLEEKNQ